MEHFLQEIKLIKQEIIKGIILKHLIQFIDENKEAVEYIFSEKPTALELGTKVMEMFEYKERYDGIIE